MEAPTTALPLVILLLSNLMNLVVILVLVYGFDLGVAGAAWSTVIAQAAAGAAFLVVIRSRPRVCGDPPS